MSTPSKAQAQQKQVYSNGPILVNKSMSRKTNSIRDYFLLIYFYLFF